MLARKSAAQHHHGDDIMAAIDRARGMAEQFIQERVDEIKRSQAGRDMPRVAIELDVRRHSHCHCAIARRLIEEIERERQIAARQA
jgi:hypothetical protein